MTSVDDLSEDSIFLHDSIIRGHHISRLHILYSRKYWQELNLVVEPKIAIARILVDLYLAVRYGIVYTQVGNFGGF